MLFIAESGSVRVAHSRNRRRRWAKRPWWGHDTPPYFLPDLLEEFCPGFGGAITDFQKGMEEAQNDRDTGKQALPGCWRGRPTVSVNRRGCIVRINCLASAANTP